MVAQAFKQPASNASEKTRFRMVGGAMKTRKVVMSFLPIDFNARTLGHAEQLSSDPNICQEKAFANERRTSSMGVGNGRVPRRPHLKLAR